MKNNIKNTKISLNITIFSIIVSLIGIIASIIHLQYSIANEKPIGSDVASFWCILTIFLANITLFLLNRNK